MQRQGESYRVVVEPSPDPADLAMLEDRVAAAAVAVARADEQEFGIFLRDDGGEVVGGVCGLVLDRCCELQAMWVNESLRGRGLARALMAAAEAEAWSRGCTLVMFHTYDVLTHRLHERLGYRTVGVIENCLAGGAVRWYAKDLTDHTAPGSQRDSSSA